MADQNIWFDTDYFLRETSRILDAASKNTILNLDALQAEEEADSQSNELLNDCMNNPNIENPAVDEFISVESHFHEQTPLKSSENVENVSSPWDWDTPSSKALDSLSASLNPKVSMNHGNVDDNVRHMIGSNTQDKNISDSLNSMGKNVNITDGTQKEKAITKKTKTKQKNKSLDFFGLSSTDNTDEVDNDNTNFGTIRLPHINIGYNMDNTFSFFDDIDDIDLNEDRILKQINDFNVRGIHMHYLFITSLANPLPV